MVEHKFSIIFVTVGTTKFNALIDSLLTNDFISSLYKVGCKRLIVQYGDYSNIDALNLFKSIPNLTVELFDYTQSFEDYIQQADLIIGHGGAGTCLEVLRLDKPLLVVTNNELMDNHQQELADELEENNYIISTDIQNLPETLKCFNRSKLKPFPKHNPTIFRNFIRDILQK